MRKVVSWKVVLLVSGFLFLSGVTTGYAQTSYVWEELSQSPYVGRHNDVFFTTPDSGWIVNGDGDIFHTEDGGLSWGLQYRNLNAHFRSVGFLNDQHGFAGNVGPGEFGTVEATPIFETVDGGQIWLPATGFQDGLPAGICGMEIVNDSTVVAVGRVRGPAFFVRTVDSGETWSTVDMSSHAAGLIDLHFTHPDSGIVVGLTNVDHDQSSGVILRTTDGGETWENIFTSTRVGEWFWKLSFPTESVGYGSLQRNSESPIYFVKTTDGGATWEEKLFLEEHYFVQGIGFADENTGWIGGNSSSPVYYTTDGGDTWLPDEVRPRVNRIRFLGDSLGYAVGRSAYRINKMNPLSVDEPGHADKQGSLEIFPNPFSDRVTIRVATDTPIESLEVVNSIGQRVQAIDVETGRVDFEWDGLDANGRRVASGLYFVVATTTTGSVTQGVVRLEGDK